MIVIKLVSSKNKNKKVKRKKSFKAVLIVILVLALAVAGGTIALGFHVNNRDTIFPNVSVNGIDLSDTPDGSYVGTYEHGRWTNTVSVRVESGRVIEINIVDDVFGGDTIDCSDEIFSRVIESQNTQVDAVSGATVTSKAYLKAIENALEN